MPPIIENVLPNTNLERRFANVTVRAVPIGAAQPPVIEGVAAVYDQEAVIAESFREIFRPGAFTQVLAQNPDVIGVPNHDWNTVFGRTGAGTLHLSDQPDGLHYSIDINPADQEAMNFYARVQRGDVKESSFAFSVGKDVWTQAPDQLPLREVWEVSELIDVSPVTFPAFPQTSASVRSKLSELQQTVQPIESQAAPDDETTRVQARARMANRRRYLDLAERL